MRPRSGARERGLLEAAAAPADGRRTLLTLIDRGRRAVHHRAAQSAEQAVAAALSDPGQARRVVGLLDELACHLLP